MVLDYLREFNTVSVALRLVLAMLSGGMIGLERERKHRPAGFRTYMLVCLGAALTMLLSQYEFTMVTSRWSSLAEDIGIQTDVSRFGAQVINGIGFLGAGTILVTGRQQVKGLTTAAGLWASACLGLAVGAGFYECVLLSFILIYLCVYAFPAIDTFIQEHARILNLYIEFESFNDVGTIIRYMKQMQIRILDIDMEYNRKNPAQTPNAVFSIHLIQNHTRTQVVSALSDLDCIYRIEEI